MRCDRSGTKCDGTKTNVGVYFEVGYWPGKFWLPEFRKAVNMGGNVYSKITLAVVNDPIECSFGYSFVFFQNQFLLSL